MHLRPTTLALFIVALFARSAPAQPAGQVIFDMDSIRHKPTEITNKDKQKVPCGTAELVDGKFGKAVRFLFIDGASGGFFAAPVRPTPDWDQADGFSFWVKGDGSGTWGGIELIDRDDYALRYDYCFPVDSTEWRKITVRWGDLTPALAGPPVDAKAGFKPSSFGSLWFGKWWYWREYPAQTYAIDQVALESRIDVPALPAVEGGLMRIGTKLKAGKPITIVTMGDSLTDTRHWANKEIVWPQLLAQAIKAKYGSEVKVVNPAMGGTTLSQNLVVMPRWIRDTPSPDLVTIWFGGNDYDSKVSGERYAQYLRLAVDRIRRQTNGSADILIMTTAPGHARWEVYRELEQAARDVAKEKNTGLAGVAAEFRKAGGTPDEALKAGYWAWDKVHMGPKGHQCAMDTVLRAIAP